MSQDQEWCGQSRSNEYSKPSGQTIDIFDLEWQILSTTTTTTKKSRQEKKNVNQLYNPVVVEQLE